MNKKLRCFWVGDDDLMKEYHDNEWGDPVHDDRKLFEYMVLDAFQAGLSWRTILHKRDNFRIAFDNFEPAIIATYDDIKVHSLLNNKGIVRNRSKIMATINNAKLFLQIQKECGSFDQYIWQFTDYQTLRNPEGTTRDTMPTSLKESDAMSADLKKKGFKFVGTTICYAFMQAIGMVDDHCIGCFKAKKATD